MTSSLATAALVSLGLAAAGPLLAETAAPETANIAIPSGDPGISLCLRNKHPAGMTQFSPERTLLYVHGATYPAETTFDLPIEGASMMDLFAARGFDTWLVDVRGYGCSTRPPEMSEPASANKPIVSTEVAAHDFGVAVEHVLKARGLARLDVMGWSWGTAITGMYTAGHNDKVNRLVLYAPLWLFKPEAGSAAAPPAATPATLAAYRSVTREAARDRWLKGVPEDMRASLIPPGVLDAWLDATFATDPEGARQSPPVLRAPNGVISDVMAFWRAGKPHYDPGAIAVPTLVIHAEWDADLPMDQAQGYFAQLRNAPYRRHVELSEGTHAVMLEKNRMQFFREIAAFLEEQEPLALR